MKNLKRSIFALFVLCLSLVFVGCSNNASKTERKISKITSTSVPHTLVEDVASGQVISDNTGKESVSESMFSWDGDFLTGFKIIYSGQLFCSYVYTYTDGRLTEVKDETDGQLFYFSYSNGHLDKQTCTTDSDAVIVYQYLYDEQDRVKLINVDMSDGSYVYEPGMFSEIESGIVKEVTEFEYSENKLSGVTIKYFAPTDPEKPVLTTTGILRFGSVFNPFKGLITCDFHMAPWNFLSENIIEGIQWFRNGELLTETNYEITSDKDYPVRSVSTDVHSRIKDGKRKTWEIQTIDEYEYLD